MYINQQDAQILVIRLYFILDTVHVSDYISPSSGETLISSISHLVYTGIRQYVWLLCGYSHTTAKRIGLYQMRCTAYKIAPDDSLTQFETCRASNVK